MPDTSDTRETIATRMQHECDTSDTSVTRGRQEQHECYTNDTGATRVQHEWKILLLIKTQVKTFSHPYIFYMVSERLQGEEQFHTMNYILEMSLFHAKICLKSAPKKLNFLIKAISKVISKSCTLDCSCKCPCTLPHSYAQ